MEAIGVQFRNHEYYTIRNSNMYNGRRSAWVVENATVQPYVAWTLPVPGHTRVAWRDAIIIDENGEFAAFQSLTNDSLTNAADANSMRNALRQTATISDTDLDGLPDRWEQSQLGNINSGTLQDPLGTGRPLMMSYALGLGVSAQPGAGPRVTDVEVNGQKFYQMTFNRRLGLEGVSRTTPTLLTARLVYQPQVWTSTTGNWSSAAWTQVSVVDPWDGTGTESVTMRCPIPISGPSAPSVQFVRLNVTIPE